MSEQQEVYRRWEKRGWEAGFTTWWNREKLDSILQLKKHKEARTAHCGRGGIPEYKVREAPPSPLPSAHFLFSLPHKMKQNNNRMYKLFTKPAALENLLNKKCKATKFISGLKP